MDSNQQIQQQSPPIDEATGTIGPGEGQDLSSINLFLQTCCPLLDYNKDKFYKTLHEPANQDLLNQFALDRNLRVLLISKIDQTQGDEGKEQLPDGQEKAKLTELLQGDDLKISCKVQFYGPIAHSIAFLKRDAFAVLDLSSDTQDHISKQMQVINLGYIGEDFNIFELAATYVEYSLVPLFNSYKQSQKGAEARSSQGFENIQKNLNQLKVNLVQCQKNIRVPDVDLVHDPEIIARFEECQKTKTEMKPDDFEENLKDPAFIQRLEKIVYQWIRDIRKVTQMNNDPSEGQAIQEIQFWNSIERSLAKIDEQLKSPMIDVTKRLLKSANKIQLILNFELDTDLAQKLKQARDYNKLLQDFPINQLLSASNLDLVKQAIKMIFDQFKLLRPAGGDSYPHNRAILLMNALIEDINEQLLKILAEFQIMHVEYQQFEYLKRDIQGVFTQLQNGITDFKAMVNQNRPRLDANCTQVMENILKNQLQIRLEKIFQFRRHHHQFKQIIQKTLSQEVSGDQQNLEDIALAKINDAYQLFNGFNVLDMSKEGNEHWDRAERTYNQKIDNVESQITTILKTKLSQAKNANEMFRVFHIFNALFTRPKIKGAIQEYQIELLRKVEKDIEILRDKLLNNQTSEQHQSTMWNKIRGFPAISNKILWTEQIERRLGIYMSRVEDVLGQNWKDLHQGKKLKQIGDNFQQTLSARQEHYLQTWLAEIKEIDAASERAKNIFQIEQRIDRFHFFLDFNMKLLHLPQELNQLKIMEKKMPLGIQLRAQDVQHLYPIAMSLQESLRTFEYTENRVAPKFEKLVAECRKLAQEKMIRGLSIQWKSDTNVEKYANELRKFVTEFEEAVNDVTTRINEIDSHLEQLQTCELDQEMLAGQLEKIQRIIDDFDISSYSNLQIWVDELDEQISAILIDRLTHSVQLWVKEFTSNLDENEQRKVVSVCTLKIKMTNQTFVLDPPIAEARAGLYTQLHEQIEVICGLRRVEAQRYGRYKKEGNRDQTYTGLVKQMKDYNIMEAYESLENVLCEAETYFKQWRRYQSLWDLQSSQIYDQLGEDVEKWTQLLNEIKHEKKTFDSVEDKKIFAAVHIFYGNVKQEVYNKYDQWHKEILSKFGTKLKGTMKGFYSEIQGARRKLEILSIDASEDVTMFVTDIQDIKRSVQGWEASLERMKKGQRLLNAQRYQFPNDWLWIDIVEFEWNQSFLQILEKKSVAMEDQIPAIQAKIMDEEKNCNSKIKEIELEWEKTTPKNADFTPKEALDLLNIIGKKISTSNDEWVRICKAKELLDMELGDPLRLQSLVEDHGLLKSVWAEIHKVWQNIDQINETLLSAYVYKKVKEALDKLLEQMNDFPNRLRSHNVYDEYKSQLQKYRKVNHLFLELKSEAMKPRHWKKLLLLLKIKVHFQDLILLNLWQADLIKNNKVLNEVLSEARGEMILEEFIRSIKDCWAKYELDLVRYANKCRLIRGWDELFTQIDEHINNIASMKMSPYYKVFEEDIVPWDEKLQRIRIIFDNWIDVQRRYVYLEGIFFGSADIKSMLTTEFNKFRGIDNEFTSLMKKVAQKPIVLDVMSIQNLQQNLERFSDMLSKIQKALGDYLEKQRQSFARFYFVGDEDLLEIIGNSKEIRMVQRHFPKMFAGITSTQFEKEGDQINGMFSREGEYVQWSKSVTISEDPTIYVWLQKIEQAMQISLAHQLLKSIEEMSTIDIENDQEDFIKWIEKYPAQIDILSIQVFWSNKVEDCLKTQSGANALVHVEQRSQKILELLADRVLQDLEKDIRQKYEQLITDLVHQKETTRLLIDDGTNNINDFAWLYHMRFYFDHKCKNAVEQLQIKLSNGNFFYGFEYLGVGEKLVQTPLTDRCYLTLTQAMHWRMGGSPFGPAGTGKTESVKALGSQLGRYVLVFNCDETFDGNAMGRIFVGLCQVGAWGCFDEFNRLEERMLSAVSQQILIIQQGLKEKQKQIDLMGRDVKLNEAMGIFITMNPGYAGRSNLPDNLKQLFRQQAMVKPNKEMIARVKLYSQGFKTSEKISGKIVSLFDLCLNQLSAQSHYDFGLRALKSVLTTAGNLKRAEKAKLANPEKEIDDEWEKNIIIQSICNTLVPKLIAQDIPLLESLLQGVFPGTNLIQIKEEKIREQLDILKGKYNLVMRDNFVEKVLQLNQILNLHHGVMMVGPTGCGKSQAWRILLESLEKLDGTKGVSYIIDPKAINKDELYGKLDSTTAEWTDGVFTLILRKVIDNQRGESSKRHWIIFDGDVDPEWAENLNSVLDDNKLLTLPSGERLQIPENVKIMFEVETLKYATLATVSRCGMVWFSDDTISTDMIYQHYLLRLKQEDYDNLGEDPQDKEKVQEGENAGESPQKPKQAAQISDPNFEINQTRAQCVDSIREMFNDQETPSFATRAIEFAETLQHVMEFTKIRVLEAMFALVRRGITNVIEYNENHSDFPLSSEQVASYMQKWTVFAALWGVGGSLNLQSRSDFGEEIKNWANVDLPVMQGDQVLLDFEVSVDDQQWHLWKKRVPNIQIEPSKVQEASTVINTVDTARHQEVLCSWLSEHRPFLLCGPPGSGKTMTLMATLKMLTDMEMIFINFSSSTKPDLILKTFDHYCEYKKTPKGIILRPRQNDKWLVVFCDEINLPEEDKYGTQVVIAFLRQITEHNGFYRSSDKQFIRLERIQFVGACNPPTDSGRQVLSERFLRHAPLIFVDFPGPDSLKQIYGTFNQAMLSQRPAIKSHAQSLTEAMVEFYTRSQKHFTADQQPHYIYSPRELTRWKLGIFEALAAVEDVEDLVRLFVHEGLRLFEDRLVYAEEKEWCNQTIDEVANKWFPNMDSEKALRRPILFSDFIKKEYVSCKQEELKQYIEGRLKTFYEEELNVQLVVFDSVIDHILRIDRVYKQPQGHMLLVGASGVGKTTLTRFVAWLQNLSVFQIKAGRNYSVYDFDEDLRSVMKRSGCKQEKICFIFDESNVLSAAFLERMNALLAGGEVPGLFDGDEYMALINACKEAALREGKIIDTEEELYKHFIHNVQRNLHVVFTMNPQNPDFSNRTASSPALFNRCVIDWFGDWTDDSLLQVAKSLTEMIEIPDDCFSKSVGNREDQIMDEDGKIVDPKNELLSKCIVDLHKSVRDVNHKLQKQAKKFNYITPRDFLDFIKHFTHLKTIKQQELVELQSHLNNGLNKLKESEAEVQTMQAKLTVYQEELKEQEKIAQEKLVTMLGEQRNAEKQKDISEKTAVKLVAKQKEAAERQYKVENELGDAEPALIEAQKALSGVTSKDLAEIRVMQRPPEKVRVALEPVVALLSKTPKKPEWADVKAYIKRDDFISSIMNFNKDDIPNNVKNFITKNYIEDTANFNVEAINKASKAAGPLAKWVSSIVRYSTVFHSIEPLRKELQTLNEETEQMVQEKTELDEKIAELEQSIEILKLEYAANIAKVENIKNDMKSVQEKVTRSVDLIKNLSSERERWDESSKNFINQMACLVGDTLFAAGFLTYIGFFDHFYRQYLQADWRDAIEMISLKMRQDLKCIEFLSDASERLLWEKEELPPDELCIENAIIMKEGHFNRYPLVIDPSDQALNFIMNHYKQKKIVKTSFADDGFMKHLETAIRFGLPLLVQDVEKIDPILNSVLNKEIQKAGGRILIRVGDQEIDYSEKFVLYMITRDPNAQFTPDLCSRVTFVNFTVTPSSLQNKCLNIFLKEERPDIDKKRSDIIKLQGEFRVKLRELEDKLLNELTESEGNLLQNDKLIKTLEKLQSEAKQISQEVEKADETMKQIQEVTEEYLPLAMMSSKIFFSLDSMSEIHYLYQYSLQYFMEILYSVIQKSEKLSKVPKTNYEARRTVLTQEFFDKTYENVSKGLFQEHQTLFALRLVQIRKGLDEGFQKAFSLFMKTTSIIDSKLNPNLITGKLTNNQLAQIEDLDGNFEFSGLVSSIESDEPRWNNFMESAIAEQHVPEPWKANNPDFSVEANQVMQMTIIKTLRPDRLIDASSSLIKMVISEDSLSQGQVELDKIVDHGSNADSPLLLVSAPGYDASYIVDQLARTRAKKFSSVAIGSPEAFDEAESAIKLAARSGSWVLLKNVHLAPSWLIELEKMVYKLQLNPQFRLFLTMEVNPKVPTTLLRASYVLMFEPPSGIKAAMTRSYNQAISQEKSDNKPVQRAKLHFIVAWFNAVVQERLRFIPIGWSKTYEFNQSDQRCVLDCCDQWIDSMGRGREAVDPDKIPWDALRTIVSQSVFGGKIDNDFDHKILQSLVNYFFRKETFDKEYPLFKSMEAEPLTIPDYKSYKDFKQWTQQLPSSESPAWSGLPLNVEKLNLIKRSGRLITEIKLIQDTEDAVSVGQGAIATDGQAQWLIQLEQKITVYSNLLPATLQTLKRAGSLVKNPLFRFLERECDVLSNLLNTVRRDFGLVLEVCRAERKSTNAIKAISTAIHADIIPPNWKKNYIVPDTFTAGEWLNDFKKRVDQMERLVNKTDFGRSGIWYGGLLSPEAYLIATQQATAQLNNFSLEELELRFNFDPSEDEKAKACDDQTGFIINGLSIESAEYDVQDKRIKLSNKLSAALPTINMTWVHRETAAKIDQGNQTEFVELPVYLNRSRKQLLTSVKMPTFGIEPFVWYQRGVAIFAQ